jgi:hypothetical protein
VLLSVLGKWAKNHPNAMRQDDYFFGAVGSYNPSPVSRAVNVPTTVLSCQIGKNPINGISMAIGTFRKGPNMAITSIVNPKVGI